MRPEPKAELVLIRLWEVPASIQGTPYLIIDLSQTDLMVVVPESKEGPRCAIGAAVRLRSFQFLPRPVKGRCLKKGIPPFPGREQLQAEVNRASGDHSLHQIRG